MQGAELCFPEKVYGKVSPQMEKEKLPILCCSAIKTASTGDFIKQETYFSRMALEPAKFEYHQLCSLEHDFRQCYPKLFSTNFSIKA